MVQKTQVAVVWAVMLAALRRRKTALYRASAGLVVILVVVLALQTSRELGQARMPDPWAYAFAIENFAQGRWVVTDEEAAAGRMRARLQGGHLTQYVNVGSDRWALEKAPGFPLLAVPFRWLGIPQLTNSVLAVLAAAALYVAVARWLDEGLACAAVILFLLAPMSLMALRDVWMDSFAAGAVPVIGGALYALYLLRPDGRAGLVLAFGAGLALGWSVVVRLTNAPLVGLCGLHLLIDAWRAPRRRQYWIAVAVFALGATLALGVLAAYNLAVFGRPFDFGYAYSLYRVSSALGPSAGKPGQPSDASLDAISAIQMIGRNLVRIVQPWILGFPLLALAVPGWILAREQGSSSGADRGVSFPHWIALLWVLAVAVPYVTFTWLDDTLAEPLIRGKLFFEVDRYFLPWIFPLTTMAVVTLVRLPHWAAWGLVSLYGMASLWFYLYVLSVL
ncbi:MAG: hypothetical protein JXA14_24365 [Anaerolineae bacterium]|nr:hypothetical protein [Anaerolineae bacterium]